MEQIPVSLTSFANTLIRALISGMTYDITAVSAEMFAISSIGDKMLIILTSISRCEGLSIGTDLSIP